MENTEKDRTSQVLHLQDGRRLGYAEFGDPNGWPVIFFHGWGDSRLTRHPDDSLATRLGIHLVTIDRPGVGLSDFQPGRRLLDWPQDVAQLADALGWNKFTIFGHSGGGPHVLACARAIPERLWAAGIASGVAPLDRPGGTRGMSLFMRFGYAIFRRAPGLAKVFLASMPGDYRRNAVKAYEKQWEQGIPAGDRAVLDLPGVRMIFVNGAVEALRSGVDGLAQELTLFLGRPWGFQPEEIQIPVLLWYGEDDNTAPPQMGRYLAEVIPNSQLKTYPGEGHLNFINNWQEILSDLLAASRASAEREGLGATITAQELDH